LDQSDVATPPENETIKMENVVNQRYIPPRILEYIEAWDIMKKYTWVEICDGRLFCKVGFKNFHIR